MRMHQVCQISNAAHRLNLLETFTFSLPAGDRCIGFLDKKPESVQTKIEEALNGMNMQQLASKLGFEVSGLKLPDFLGDLLQAQVHASIFAL